MSGIIIKTPRGEVFTTKTRNGKTTARLKWNPDFGNEQTAKFSRAQKFLDSEVLRTTTPYVPIRSSALIKSGQLGTVVGSGEVSWTAPYAARQYYDTAQARPYDAQRGAHWFERAKADHKGEWVSGAKKMYGK